MSLDYVPLLYMTSHYTALYHRMTLHFTTWCWKSKLDGTLLYWHNVRARVDRRRLSRRVYMACILFLFRQSLWNLVEECL